MLKIYSIMAAAALIAGALVVAPSLSPVSASTRGQLTNTANGKGDRLDVACARVSELPELRRTCEGIAALARQAFADGSR